MVLMPLAGAERILGLSTPKFEVMVNCGAWPLWHWLALPLTAAAAWKPTFCSRSETLLAPVGH